MATLKYLDPVTGEYKKIASGGGGTSIPAQDTEPATGNYWLDTSENPENNYVTKDEVADLIANAAPAYTYGTEDLEAGVTHLESGKLYFVYE